MVGGGRPLPPKILGQATPVGAKSPILNLVPEILDQSDRVGAEASIFALFSLLAPQS